MTDINIYLNTNLIDGTAYTVDWSVEFKDLNEPKDLDLMKGRVSNVDLNTATKKALGEAFLVAVGHWGKFYSDLKPVWVYNSEEMHVKELLLLL